MLIAIVSLGDNLYELDEYGSAISAYKKALVITPCDSTIWISLGDSYLELNEYQDAKNAYIIASELDPNCAEAYLGLGHALLELGEYAEANSFYLKAMKTGGLTLDQLKEAKINIDILYGLDEARTIPDDENDIQARYQDLIDLKEASLIGEMPMSDIS